MSIRGVGNFGNIAGLELAFTKGRITKEQYDQGLAALKEQEAAQAANGGSQDTIKLSKKGAKVNAPEAAQSTVGTEPTATRKAGIDENATFGSKAGIDENATFGSKATIDENPTGSETPKIYGPNSHGIPQGLEEGSLHTGRWMKLTEPNQIRGKSFIEVEQELRAASGPNHPEFLERFIKNEWPGLLGDTTGQ